MDSQFGLDGPPVSLINAARAMVACELNEHGLPADQRRFHAALKGLVLALADLEPTRPAPLETRPASLDTQPTSLDTQPAHLDTRPAHLDTRPDILK